MFAIKCLIFAIKMFIPTAVVKYNNLCISYRL